MSIDFKFLPFNAHKVIASSDVDTVTFTSTEERAQDPYPPGKVQINGVYWPNGGDLSGNAVLTWQHRIRTAQELAAIVHQDASSMAGDIEGTYTVEVLIDGIVEAPRTTTGITGTTFTYTAAQRAADDGDPNKLVQFRITPVFGVLEGTARLTDSFKMV